MKTIKEKILLKKLGTFERIYNENNLTMLYFNKGVACYSYNTLVAARINDLLYFSVSHSQSATTNKHIVGYCGVSKQDRIKGLEDGRFIMIVQ